MTINRVLGGFRGYDIYCDKCNREGYIDIEWDAPLREVLAGAEDKGWQIVRVNGEWKHRCLSCRKD